MSKIVTGKCLIEGGIGDIKMIDSLSDAKKLKIPAYVRIGVTGHRTLASEQLIRESVKSVLGKLDKMLGLIPHTFIAVSPLAEGADRLVAKEVLEWQASDDKPGLEAVLPLPVDDYMRDFASKESKDEFKAFLAKAKSVITLRETTTREAAYENVGHYVVDNCDFLIAIWNGEPSKGQGGTAEIVEYARKIERYVFWINSENGTINEEKNGENHNDHLLESLKHLDTYNSESLSDDKYISGLKAECDSLAKHAEKSGLKELFLHPLRDHLLPHYARTDILAMKYQKIHMLTGSLTYALAAAAVATVTFYMLFFPDYPKLLIAEFAEVALILLLLIFAHFGEWQRKWIDYRFLAERLRVALFLGAAGIDCKIPKPPPYLNVPHLQDDWTIRAFSGIWNIRPQAQLDIPIVYLKNFLRAAWIDDQVNFYKKASKRHGNSHTLYARTGEILFALTIVVATLDAFVLGHSPQSDFSFSPGILASLAIILPTASAALAGIRVHREYLRNAERYSHMGRYLSAISEQVKQAQDMVILTGILEEANEMIFLENWDWRAAFWLRKPEVL